MKGIYAIGAALAAGMVSVPAHAALTTFASYQQQDTSQNSILFRNSGTGMSNSGTGGVLGTSTTKNGAGNSSVEVFSSYFGNGLDSTQAAQLQSLSSKLTVKATIPNGNPASVNKGVIDQEAIGGTALTGIPGSLSLIYDGPTFTLTGTNIVGGSFTIATGANLLTATYKAGSIIGKTNSTSPSFENSTFSGGQVTYTSDLYNFNNLSGADFSLALSALKSFGAGVGTGLSVLTPNVTSLRSFQSTSAGVFAADPAPKFSFVNASTPEAGTWAIMIVGFGVVGAVARSRKFGSTFNFA